MAFSSEDELMIAALNSKFIQGVLNGSNYMKTEPKGLFGIPDLVIVDLLHTEDGVELIQTYAFEMKLSQWKRALIQAFRYRAFAENVYVVLDYHFIEPALIHLDDFVRSNIGLISIDELGNDIVHSEPVFDIPYSGYLKNKLIALVSEEYQVTEAVMDYQLAC